jgi:integrase
MTLETYFERLLGQGYSRKTATVYANALRPVMTSGVDLATATALEISQIAETVKNTTSTRASLRSALKHYFELTGRHDGPYRAVRVPTRARMHCRALSDRDAALLAHHARARGDLKGLAVLLGLYGGLRRMEIASLAWGDLTGDGWLTVTGKGRTRTIPLHPIVLELWRKLGRRQDPRALVFAGRWGDVVNPTTIWTWVRELSLGAGVDPVPTHVLRHTALATALDNSHDLRAVQELAGHAKPETTAGYTRVRAERLVAVAQLIQYGGAR